MKHKIVKAWAIADHFNECVAVGTILTLWQWRNKDGKTWGDATQVKVTNPAYASRYSSGRKTAKGKRVDYGDVRVQIENLETGITGNWNIDHLEGWRTESERRATVLQFRTNKLSQEISNAPCPSCGKRGSAWDLFCDSTTPVKANFSRTE